MSIQTILEKCLFKHFNYKLAPAPKGKHIRRRRCPYMEVKTKSGQTASMCNISVGLLLLTLSPLDK